VAKLMVAVMEAAQAREPSGPQKLAKFSSFEKSETLSVYAEYRTQCVESRTDEELNKSRNTANIDDKSDLERLIMVGGHCIVNVDFEDDQIVVMLSH
jgi:hypothetical protein